MKINPETMRAIESTRGAHTDSKACENMMRLPGVSRQPF
jgi:hypothetical protein